MITPLRACQLAVLAALPVLLAACAVPAPSADIPLLYGNAARIPEDERNPVIVLPGILGSRLYHPASETIVWGAYVDKWADPKRAEDARLIAHPMEQGKPLDQIRDDVVADGALETLEISLLGIRLPRIGAYRQIMLTLGAGGYQDGDLVRAAAAGETASALNTAYREAGHYTCEQFEYDWRRDNVENARQLGELIRASSDYATEIRGGGERVKVDLVCHSMGGLLARYWLRYGDQDLPADGSLPELTWAGAEYVDRVVIVGTPNAGSAEAIVQLVNGWSPAKGILPTYNAQILGSMPAIYQLLPRDRHGPLLVDEGDAPSLFDPQTWIDYGWGLADPDAKDKLAALLPDLSEEDRRATAIDHLTKCLARAEQFHRALDEPAKTPEGLELMLIAGDAEDTVTAVRVVERKGQVRVKPETEAPGDGTVARTSALLDERLGAEWTPGLKSPIDWDHVNFYFYNHLGLTQTPMFTDNVLFYLLEQPRD